MTMDALFDKLKAMRARPEQEGQGDAYLLVGLGNKGPEYRNTRHNAGFMVVDEIAERIGETFSRVEQQALIAKGSYNGHRLILAKPQTYMNLSGRAVKGLLSYYKLELSSLLIIYDEADLEFETIRLRPDGGSAGHNGIKSVREHLGTEEFARLRVGIGRPPGKMRTPDYVLQDFSKAQMETLPFVIERAADAALAFVTEGMDAAMNRYNQKPSA